MFWILMQKFFLWGGGFLRLVGVEEVWLLLCCLELFGLFFLGFCVLGIFFLLLILQKDVQVVCFYDVGQDVQISNVCRNLDCLGILLEFMQKVQVYFKLKFVICVCFVSGQLVVLIVDRCCLFFFCRFYGIIFL